VKAVRNATRVYPVEVSTATPLSASFASGKAETIIPAPSFVDGMGGKSVFESMWPLARALVQRPLVVSVAEIAAGIRLLAERARIVAEGAGGATVAAVVRTPRMRATGSAGDDEGEHRKIVCIISGGNINRDKLAEILSGANA
jgi:threonine dehydratase